MPSIAPGAGVTDGAARATLRPGPADASGLTTELLWLALGFFAAWTALFYLLVLTKRWWYLRLPRSRKKHENDLYWNVAQVCSFIHATIIAAISVPTLFMLATEPSDVQYPPFEGEQPWCTAPPSHDRWKPLNNLYMTLAMVGLAFTTHLMSDLFTSLVHGIASIQQIMHHCAFIAAGVIIRGHCLLPLNASVLMAMEASTPFLNFLMIFRNRGEGYAFAVQLASYFFLAFFVVFRLIVNTYGLVVLWANHDRIVPPTVAAWHVWFLLVVITAGALIQFFFFFQIMRNFSAKARRPVTPAESESPLNQDDSPCDEVLPKRLSDIINPGGETPMG